MNGTFEWYGFSVARKHVYFYSLLILTSIFTHNLIGPLNDPGEPDATSTQLRQLAERVASGDASPRY
jgi:hypothetical protein